MHFAAVLNRDGGTLRTIDLDDFTRRLKETLEDAGHVVDIDVVSGGEMIAALEKAAARHVDAVMVGGGDGTVSAAAARLQNKRKALAVLPAGTMNLFARSLGIPQDLDEAIRAFAAGHIKAVDMATANGRPFIHQFSVGMHAKMVHLRDKMEFGSRWGKISASARAAWMTLQDPPVLDVKLLVGEAEIVTRATSIGITNNLFGEGHLPYADEPAGGTLGIYLTVARQKTELFRMAAGMLRGRWRDNDHIEVHQTQTARLELRSTKRGHKAVIDGELSKLEAVTTFEIHPGALNVVVPGQVEGKQAA